MDRSLGDGREFEPYQQELFEDHLPKLLERGHLMGRLGSSQSPRAAWSDLSARIGRNDKPGVLLAAVASGLLNDRELRIGIEDSWTTSERPGRTADHDVWTYFFELAGVDNDHYLHETELRDRSRLPETKQLYHAVAEGHQTGLSWTTSFERAHWFATRLGALSTMPHQVYEINAPREAVLAHFHATLHEHKYVVDTGLLDPTIPNLVPTADWEILLDSDRDSTADKHNHRPQ